MRYDEVLGRLRTAYDGGAAERDRRAKDPWRLAEREAFLARLREHGATRLLEIGAGTGQDSAYFQENGRTVVATDLSPEMVAHCRAKGLDARVADFLSLDFAPGSFDAVYAVNCLLHVPDADLPAVLGAVRDVLRPGGLFYLGAWGGADWEGIHERDDHDPPRYFRFRSDELLQRYARELFEVVDFHTVPVGENRFQALTLMIKTSL